MNSVEFGEMQFTSDNSTASYNEKNTASRSGGGNSKKNKKNKKSPAVFILILIIIILAGLLVFFFVSEKYEIAEKTFPEPVIISAVTLSGEELDYSNADSSRSFGADRAIDKSYDSCWCVSGENGTPEGCAIKINLNGKSTVKGIKIINGNLYSPEDKIYLNNGQLKSFTLVFSNDTKQTFTAPLNSSASAGYVNFDFPEPVNTEYIKLIVNSYYPGKKYSKNVCIGEIGVY